MEATKSKDSAKLQDLQLDSGRSTGLVTAVDRLVHRPRLCLGTESGRPMVALRSTGNTVMDFSSFRRSDRSTALGTAVDCVAVPGMGLFPAPVGISV